MWIAFNRELLKPLVKSVLLRLGLTAADPAIHKKMFWSGTTTLINSNEKNEWYHEYN